MSIFAKQVAIVGSKPTLVSLNLLKERFGVRVAGLDFDQVDYLASVLRSGGNLPPITVNSNYEIIKGRHRKEAHKRAGNTHVPVVVVPNRNVTDEILDAVSDDARSSTPLHERDIRFAIRQLLSHNGDKEVIISKLSQSYPKTAVEQWFKEALHIFQKDKIEKASDLILKKGMTLEDGAKAAGVTLTAVRASMARKRKNYLNPVQERSKRIGEGYRRVSRAVIKELSTTLSDFESESLNLKQAAGLVKHAVELQKKLNDTVINYEARFNRMAR